jgi:microcin C transport system substrate-binding protein
LPPDIFTTPVTPPAAEDEAGFRALSLEAGQKLQAAGYSLKDGQLIAPSGKAVTFEIVLNNPAEEKVALAWTRALQRLGIAAAVHTVDSAQYQRRLAAFDFDATPGKWINTLSPGNEQIFYWGTAAAAQNGSRNYAGIHDAVIDALATAIPAATSREDLVATAHALDRVLLAGHYMVPLYYAGIDRYASWSFLHHPATTPLYGTVLESWWTEAKENQ